MVREIIDWCDKEYDKSLKEENDLKGIARAFKSGFVEGALDGFVIGGLALTILGITMAIVEPKK